MELQLRIVICFSLSQNLTENNFCARISKTHSSPVLLGLWHAYRNDAISYYVWARNRFAEAECQGHVEVMLRICGCLRRMSIVFLFSLLSTTYSCATPLLIDSYSGVVFGRPYRSLASSSKAISIEFPIAITDNSGRACLPNQQAPAPT
jgi:hypothetical protein